MIDITLKSDGMPEASRAFSKADLKGEAADKIREIIEREMKIARGKIAKDIHAAMPNDPRETYRAVRRAVYKKVFGGNINILNKRRGKASPVPYDKPRTLQPGQRGGNRIKPSKRTQQLDNYFGSDRGFILRFLNSGTSTRTTRYGNRGAISGKDLFGRIGPWQMDTASKIIAREIEKQLADALKL